VPSTPIPRDDTTDVLGAAANGWHGHFPVTCVALLTLLNRAASGQIEFSRIARLLCVACEFWAAANARELGAHLDFERDDPLRDARFAFSAIGAEHVVDVLHRAIDARAQSHSSGAIIADMEDLLTRVQEPVDMLIARFAWRYLCEERRSVQLSPRRIEGHHYYEQLIA
jgi:hypothetical protein